MNLRADQWSRNNDYAMWFLSLDLLARNENA